MHRLARRPRPARASYAEGRLDPVGQAAVETHLERCAECQRDAASGWRPPTSLPCGTGCWTRCAPRLPPLPRALRRLGVPETDLVVLRPRRISWSRSAAAVATDPRVRADGCPAQQGRQQLACLAIAPLLPALLVAAAYDASDPLRELMVPPRSAASGGSAADAASRSRRAAGGGPDGPEPGARGSGSGLAASGAGAMSCSCC